MRAPPPVEGILVCCPVCDTLLDIPEIRDGVRLRCIRCNTVIANGQPRAIMRIVVLSLTSLILMTIVVFYPFLSLRNGVFDSEASVFDVVMSFNTGIMAPLSIAVGFFVIVLPVARLLALVWALGPLAIDRMSLPGAATTLRLAEVMRPWAMAEIFMVGVAVALIKLADLATLSVGPAFWSFAAIVFITALQDTQMSKLSLWTELDKSSRR